MGGDKLKSEALDELTLFLENKCRDLVGDNFNSDSIRRKTQIYESHGGIRESLLSIQKSPLSYNRVDLGMIFLKNGLIILVFSGYHNNLMSYWTIKSDYINLNCDGEKEALFYMNKASFCSFLGDIYYTEMDFLIHIEFVNTSGSDISDYDFWEAFYDEEVGETLTKLHMDFGEIIKGNTQTDASGLVGSLGASIVSGYHKSTPASSEVSEIIKGSKIPLSGKKLFIL